MEKVSLCVQRIRLIKCINRGIVTHDQVAQIAALYDLSEEQQKAVYEHLKRENIIPISQETFEPPAQEAEPCLRAQPLVKREQEQNETPFDHAFREYIETLRRYPERSKRYSRDLLTFLKLLEVHEAKPEQSVYDRVVDIAIEMNRVYAQAENFTVSCGTHAQRVKKNFVLWLARVYTAEELTDLLERMKCGGTFTEKQIHKVEVLIANLPRFILRTRRLREFLES